ncbi:hypothetical protein T069G_07929 [Trichoderma breve]|uniref:Pfs domain protein n=1 Tax=Trichoderma breve TaxID=2034170 RepID=A0A9W9E569_9HYPO|nr:hypothetical protein T069G_07929 [Trichoderma breve]KAJ4857032.1 hypothetical protein T069G_07929 [Trichoderma breve]
MTDPLDDELASTSGYPEEMDLDEEDIDLDDVVPDLNPPNSATGGMIDYLAGIGGFSGQRTPINPFANLQTGESSSYSSEPLTWQGDLGQTPHPHMTSSLPGSGSPDMKLPSQNAATASADPAKVKVAPSVKTDSGYGSVTHETPKLPQKLQTKKVIREPFDIVIEGRLIEAPPFQDHEDATNSQTLYTGDQVVMGASKARRYILEFANHLYSHLQKPFADDKISSVIESLRDLLEAFALKLGQTSQLQIKRDAMYFIYTERDQITQLMRALFNGSRPTDESNMEFGNQVGETEDIESFLNAVTKDPAFKWLVGKLQGLLTSTYINSDAMKNISDHLIQGLPPIQGISRHHPSKPFRVTFDVECDILGFIKDQEYYGAAAEVVPNVITLTGSSDDVQATTCEQYLLQTWPTVGCNLLWAIQGALREYNASKSPQSSYQCKFEDRTKIKVSIGERSLKVEAIGTIHCIAEIGEQIGWFATAFKPTFHDLEISFCHPELISFQAEDNLHLLSDEFEKSFRCRILTVLDDIKVNRLPYAGGQCWQQMFNNPIIVTGYPIKPRENIESGAGLEIPFEMMTTLSDARYLTTFNGKTVLKGFSTVLLPMRQQDDLIIWHLLVDISGARISYLDPRIQQGILISSDNMQNTRHILGWCSEALKNIGSPGANYDIKYSGLSQGKSSLSLEKIEVSVGAGEYFKVGTSFRRGLREGVFARRMSDGYDDRVDHIANQYITLYDVKEKRAWLSDGLPVLLHLVRTSLRRDEKDDPDGLGINLVKNLNEAPPAVQGTMAAKVVLYDADNRSISLRSRTKVTEVTTNRIVDGKTFTEHVKKQETSRQDGILRRAPRNVLGGYEFMGVAARKNLELLTTKMSISERGSGWTDLLCSISAVTLFGNDFGELIKPRSKMKKHCNGCGLNVSLPSGENLLAVGVDVLEGILFEKGNKDTIPWRLVDDIYWHCNESAFGHCQCNISGGKSRPTCFDDRIQVLSSNNKNRRHPPLSSINTPTNGAVVFGHGRKKGVTLMVHNMEEVMVEDESDSSPEDIIRSQTSLGVSVSSDTQNENSETNENLLPDIVSSDTPNTSTSSRMDGSGLAKNTSQVSGTEGAATPDASRSTEMPLSSLILVDPNQSAFPDVMSTLPESSAATAQNASGTPFIPHRKRPIEKLKDRSTKAWKKLRHDTSS